MARAAARPAVAVEAPDVLRGAAAAAVAAAAEAAACALAPGRRAAGGR